MKTYERVCIRDWEVTAKNGDHFEVKRGEVVITSPEDCGWCTVYKGFIVDVPIWCFAGEKQFTSE